MPARWQDKEENIVEIDEEGQEAIDFFAQLEVAPENEDNVERHVDALERLIHTFRSLL